MLMLNGKQIRELRLAMGLTAEAFGKLVGPVTGNTVFRWESEIKYPSRKHQGLLNKLAAKLKTSAPA